MASNTSALPDGSTLTKPAYTDSADIAVINTNMDKIVTNINAENDKMQRNVYYCVKDNDFSSNTFTLQQYVYGFGLNYLYFNVSVPSLPAKTTVTMGNLDENSPRPSSNRYFILAGQKGTNFMVSINPAGVVSIYQDGSSESESQFIRGTAILQV